MNFKFTGYGEIVLATILWSFAGIFAKKVMGMSAQSITFYRVTFAFVILLAVFFISGSLKKIKLRDKKMYLLLFSILQIITMITYFISILEASVSIAVLLLYSAPVYVTVLSPFLLNEKSTKIGWIALIISVSGILLIVDLETIEFSQHSLGIISGILAGISYAFQIMTSKYIGSVYSGYAQAFWSFLIAMLVLIPAGIVPIHVVSENLFYLILLAIFPTILAVSLYFNGLKTLKATSGSILGLIEPLSAVILAVLILNEKITIPIILGGALILTGAAIVTRNE